MSSLKKMIFVAMSLVIYGCSSTGGTIGGLFPAPKFLEGQIKNNTYISKGGDFSISVPHKEDSYEFTYLQIKEQYNDFGAYISFGPAAMDQSIFRLETGEKSSGTENNTDFSYAVDTVITDYSYQLERGYGSKPTLLKKEMTVINNYESYIIELEQVVSNQTLKHEIIAMNLPEMAAIIWVQTSKENPTRSHLNAFDFARSFNVLR